MRNISRNALVELIKSTNKTGPAGIITRTEPKMRKTNNPHYGAIFRVVQRNVFLGADYQNSTNNKLEREGKERDFESGSLPWGQHDGRFFILHKNGKRYLKFFPQKNVREVWLNSEGQEVDKSEIEPFLYKPSYTIVPWRTVALDNVVEIKFNGEHYVLTD